MILTTRRRGKGVKVWKPEMFLFSADKRLRMIGEPSADTGEAVDDVNGMDM